MSRAMGFHRRVTTGTIRWRPKFLYAELSVDNPMTYVTMVQIRYLRHDGATFLNNVIVYQVIDLLNIEVLKE